MTKAICRKEIKQNLLLLDEKARIELSIDVSLKLQELLKILENENGINNISDVGVFAPIASEPLWFLGFKELELSEFEKLTFYPVIKEGKKDKAEMIFKKSKMSELEEKNDFGFKILGPKEKAEMAIPEIIILPGLGFTKRGERLGRGKGFYDKYLSNYRGIKIGVCFSVQILDLIPTENHDIAMDYIVTNKEIINCKLV